MKRVTTVSFMLVLGLSLLLTGCGSPEGGAATANSSAEAGSAAADVAKGLAELSPVDRDAAVKQSVCPVSGERLGSMGKPMKVTVKGQTVFLCCPGCEEDLRKEPDKFLDKLKIGQGK
jgi:hypothetical protein